MKHGIPAVVRVINLFVILLQQAATSSAAPVSQPGRSTTVSVIGAGPAGLTAAYLLARGGADVTVFEADREQVGGISRTANYRGFLFDIGGHRFFSKSREVEKFWDEILPDDMLVRPRSSRIFYGGKFYSYPLRPLEALRNLGLLESFLCGLSYLHARLRPNQNPRNFEEWVTNQFGARLFRTFFKTYTEKVWGMSCQEISADWAAQRIKGLSLGKAVFSALLPRPPEGADQVKTLISSFRYPRLGPGMMWQECAKKFCALGGTVLMGRNVVGCDYDAESAQWTLTIEDPEGVRTTTQSDHVISSTPIRTLVRFLTPRLSERGRAAAEALRYRDFLTVALICRHDPAFDDNWIYIHEPNVKVGRIQNFRSWSPEMTPDPAFSCYGLEYFCFEGDHLWESSDRVLLDLAATEMETLGLTSRSDIVDGCVVRQPKAYPVYDDDYAANVAIIRAELEERFPTLHLVGRNGMHKYNNQDHSMMTAMLTARNVLAGENLFDVWEVNEDAEYHEGHGSASSGLRATPTRVRP